jgi:hypothetical protein
MAEGQINPGSGLPILATPIELPHFDQGVTLGTGSFGRVRFVTHKVPNSQNLPCLLALLSLCFFCRSSFLPFPSPVMLSCSCHAIFLPFPDNRIALGYQNVEKG